MLTLTNVESCYFPSRANFSLQPLSQPENHVHFHHLLCLHSLVILAQGYFEYLKTAVKKSFPAQ